jgi:hypothetical protein
MKIKIIYFFVYLFVISGALVSNEKLNQEKNCIKFNFLSKGCNLNLASYNSTNPLLEGKLSNSDLMKNRGIGFVVGGSLTLSIASPALFVCGGVVGLLLLGNIPLLVSFCVIGALLSIMGIVFIIVGGINLYNWYKEVKVALFLDYKDNKAGLGFKIKI